MLIDELVKWISNCELINGNLNVDYLPPDINEYVIEPIPATTVKKKYANGDCLKQMIFYFGSRECYGSDIEVNLDNSRFYEEFEKWVTKQNLTENLPQKVTKIEVLSGGYMVEAESDRARYQIQLQVTYYEERD